MSDPIRFAVLTVSDRSATGEREDRSGPALVGRFSEVCIAECVGAAIVPDVADAITNQLRTWLDHPRPDLLLTTGARAFPRVM